ncbi:hypothetical protein WDL1P1_00796 (plasmid) [Variovorax sp. WDL1]|nr:hypothetical protein APY03_0591 [Variovorax sp. WDL1]PNG49873.1 hypothetical protein CHC06_05454 [Variovorax sp. B2]PNG50745.1 hypothetical protein CHC07_05359 [Variovorax sp. B4]VTV17958.1 hypothetical protein WDL1P1_00796 [Variovorax sp. WDL1]
MQAQVIDLTYIQACQQWKVVDEAEREAASFADSVNRCQAEMVWSNAFSRGLASEALSKAQLLHDNAVAKQAAARRRALLLSGQAAYRNWGVRLGREYRFCAASEERARFVVDFLRPAEALPAPGRCTFICAGDGPAGRGMVFLGLDEMTPHEVDSNVISLGNVMRGGS